MPFVEKTSGRGDYTVIVDGSGRFFWPVRAGTYSYFNALSRLGRAFFAGMAPL
jgi:hypothetical protein